MICAALYVIGLIAAATENRFSALYTFFVVGYSLLEGVTLLNACYLHRWVIYQALATIQVGKIISSKVAVWQDP